MSFSQLRDDLSKLLSKTHDRLNMKPSNSNKFPFKLQKADSPRNDNFIVTNLMAELAISMSAKLKLENENNHLKIENEKLNKNQWQLEKKILEEKNKCTIALNSLQEQLSNKDIQLKEQNVSTLEEVKTYLSEINDLKNELTSMKNQHANAVKEMEEKLHRIEEDLSISKRVNDDLLERVDNLTEKVGKYRNKFRFAVSLLQKMNNILQYFYQKRTTSSKKCQTEDSATECPCEAVVPTVKSKSQESFQHDNIISELFFKPNPYADNLETLLFYPQDLHRNILHRHTLK